ncbi:MAG TPA: ACT domain-containing protein [Candidatus Omnitrophota bacterium]|nr:ACT domain-containing protein [Candidatus Omnitrophota bacterium]
MIRKASLGKEIIVNVVNKIGILSDIAVILADHGINIEGIAGYAKEINKEAEILLVTSDNQRAADALRKKGYGIPGEREIVILELENKTGVLKNVVLRLADVEVDIRHIYGSCCSQGCPAKVFVYTSNNEKAIVAFNK